MDSTITRRKASHTITKSECNHGWESEWDKTRWARLNDADAVRVVPNLSAMKRIQSQAVGCTALRARDVNRNARLWSFFALANRGGSGSARLRSASVDSGSHLWSACRRLLSPRDTSGTRPSSAQRPAMEHRRAGARVSAKVSLWCPTNCSLNQRESLSAKAQRVDEQTSQRMSQHSLVCNAPAC